MSRTASQQYYVVDFIATEINPITWEEWIQKWGNETVVTPGGSADMFFIKQLESDQWQVYKRFMDKERPYGIMHNSEPAAKEELNSILEVKAQENDQADYPYSDYEEALQALAENKWKPANVIKRFISIRYIRENRVQSEAKQRSEAKRNAAQKEADAILIDSQFVDDIMKAENTTGYDKGGVMIKAVKSLLSRNGIDRTKADFWLTSRILIDKAKASQ